jgi:hypothetical protein
VAHQVMAWSVVKVVHRSFRQLHRQAAVAVVQVHLTLAALVVQAAVVVKVARQVVQEIHHLHHHRKAKTAVQVLQVLTAQAVQAAVAVRMA